MINYRGVYNGCLLNLVASICVGFGSSLVKQEPTLGQSPVKKEAMPAAGYAEASLVRKTSVQSALVTKWKAKREQTPISEVRQLNSIERSLSGRSNVLGVNRVKNLIAQLSQPRTDVVSVTDVKVNTTDKGIELILVTANSQKLQVSPKTEGNSYIVDIANTKLQLAGGESFRQAKPVAGITEVIVTNTSDNTLRLTIVGNQSPPQVELFDSDTEGLVFKVNTTTSLREATPTTVQPPTTTPEDNQEPIELIVTGTPDTRYQVPDATVGTRTNRRIQDIPQSIQVVPRQSWQDQGAVNTIDTLRSVGVIQGFNSPTNGDVFTIRGFQTSNLLRNGLKDYTSGAISGQTQLANIERLEVLRGPASVLYGQGNPGGTINFVTKQPLSEPYFAASTTFGSYSFYQPTLDISGPLNSDKTLLYRLNTSYISTESFIDFFYNQRYLIAPVLSWQISKNTKLTFESEFRDQQQYPRTGLPAVGTVLPNPNGEIPLSLNTLDEDARNNRRSILLGYNFEHHFSDNWSLVNAFNIRSIRYRTDSANSGSLQLNGRTLNRTQQNYIGAPAADEEYALDNHVVGKFKTGSLQHELVAGFDLYRDISQFDQTMRAIGTIDVFNPVYGQPVGRLLSRINQKTKNDQLGFYVQDIVTLTNNLNLVLGGRGDFVDNKVTNFLNTSTNQSQSDFAFSPRAGLVYKPIPPVSLYASYSQSFSQNPGATFEGNLFQPSTGTQYEVGVKADFLSGRLSSTLALYQLTLSNVLTPDPNRPTTFNIQTGEQRSRGIELNVTGEILPGWNVIASYAYTDGQVTKDERYIGNRLVNVPENSASLWTTYTFAKGNLQGLGFGLGLFYVGERQGDLTNSFSVPSYLRLDAAVYYRINRLRFALNVKNLSDVRYFTPRTINLVYPEDPFIVEGTVSWEL
ncbi:TonB-dependent siderophore receptor [uncultured Nostoc sp.]|uniref:TonB-dependent siderophore receptor n=1 Tax=uncultured Nostoc sp. TaxID=340711 RepID=UPI0035CB42B2